MEKENIDTQKSTEFNTPSNIVGYIEWLQKRIKKTQKELDEATELNLKIGKGAKLCVYKECLNYIKKHTD